MRRLPALGTTGSPGPENPSVPGPPTPAGVNRLTRDPAVDGSTVERFRSVGLAGDPFPPTVLGPATSELNYGTGERETPAGRPGCWQTDPFRPGLRDTDHENRGTLAPGNIRRNVTYRANGVGAQGFFSWAENEPELPSMRLDPARPPQDEYIVSSLFLGIANSLATVVSGTAKPAPGLEPFRGGATIQAQPSTGWPVLSPQIPSFGSRIPLRRPRGLVAVSE